MRTRKLNRDKLIIVTGGAGFIGSSFIRHLNDTGFDNAVVVDDFGDTEKWKNLLGKRYAEIVPIEELFFWLEDREDDIQAIVHLGAESSTVAGNGDYLLENNYRYSVQLAEYALHNEIRFIYASSAATYGDGSKGFDDDEDKLDELEPLNLYGFSKHAFDLWVKRHNLLNEFVGLKYFNVFGPNEWHKGRMASMVPHLLRQAKEDKKVKLFKSNDPSNFADGEQKRDFIYVKDAVRMTYAFLENELGGIYNIGTGTASSWNSLAKAVFKAANVPLKIAYIDMPEDLAGKYQNYTCANMAKHKENKELDADTTSLEAAVDDYVNNHLIPGKHL